MDRDAMISRLRMDAFTVPADQDYAISLFAPEDALGVARLNYSIYGNQHPFDYVYDPEAIVKLFASGTQYAVVAKSDRGDILGMIGLYKCAPWPHLFELAQLMILKNQRKKGMANALWLRAMELLPVVAKARAIFGEAVCTHTFSQRMCQESNMIPCGIVMDAIPSTAYSDTSQHEERTSLLLHAKLLCSGHQAVHMPDRYRDAYATLCGKMRMDRTVLKQQAEVMASMATLETNEFAHADCIKIWVHEPGEDLERTVAESERRVGDNGVVQVIFDLRQGTSLDAIETLRNRGYYFGGFLPCWFGADGLLLQRRKQAPRMDSLKLYNEEPKYLIDLAGNDMQESASRPGRWGEWG